MKIIVTKPCFDDIGKVLKLLDIKYKDYSGNLDCDIFFLNCGTGDVVDKKKLSDFVRKGGILYASDLTSTFVSDVFPNIFDFAGNIGEAGEVSATVCDEELINIIGNTISVNFDLGVWSVLNSVKKGKIILKSKTNNKPIMVEVPFEKGKIFYTCFHNHKQATEKETIILKLLILKQLGEYKKVSIEKISEELNINLSDYKKHFIGNFLQPDKKEVTPTPPGISKKNDIWEKLGQSENKEKELEKNKNKDIWKF